MKQTSHKTLIGSFLIIGTLLALYITIDGAYDLYWVHNTWMYRDGLIQKIGFVAISADFALLAIAGLISTVSFFLKKPIWKSITVNGNQKCSDFGNIECSIFGIKTTVLLASAVQ